MLKFLTLVILSFLSVTTAIGQVPFAEQGRTSITVGPMAPYQDLERAIRAAGPGGIVTISEGRYEAHDLEIRHDITLIGQGDVIITTNRIVKKGLLIPLAGVSLNIRNITLMGAVSYDHNGAGIRHEGKNLTVTNCRFIKNEDGILATGTDDSTVTILSSTFIDNGYGDGFSHGIYMSSGRKMIVEDSHFYGTRIGHHIKSIASQSTEIIRSEFDDRDGQPSYVIEVSGGGDLIISHNNIIRTTSAEQQTLFSYDTSRRGRVSTISITDNHITNYKPNARLLRNPENAPLTIRGNIIDNHDNGTIAMPWGDDEKPLTTRQGSLLTDKGMGLTQEADLQWLSPAQRRAVDAMRAKGLVAREIEINQTKIDRYRSEQGGNTIADTASPASSSPPFSQTVITNKSNHARQDVAIIPVREFSSQTIPGKMTDLLLQPIKAPKAHSSIATFALPFAKRRLRPNDGLTITVHDTEYPVQIDAKAFHKDGSIRHAVLTARIPNIRSETIATLYKSPAARETSAPPLPTLPEDYDLVIAIEDKNSAVAFPRKLINIREEFHKSINQPYWLKGVYASEIEFKTEVTPLLTLRSDIRLLADGSIRHRFTIENHKSFSTLDRQMTYQVTIRSASTIIMQRNIVDHGAGTNWSEIIWKGAKPAYTVGIDPSYLIKTKSIPAFDLKYGIYATTLNEFQERLAQAPNDPFTAPLLTRYMPTTGMRDEIGLLPSWDIAWIKTQSLSAYEIMLQAAEDAGSVPWHFTDDATGYPINLNQHPNFWADADSRDSEFINDAPAAQFFSGQKKDWAIDLAHKPLLSYTAYLITGDAYFKRELAHEASFAYAKIWPGYRNKPLKAMNGPQTRAKAWLLRDLSAAAWILPNNHPLKEYFVNSMSENLSAILTYVVKEPEEDRAIRGYLIAYSDEPDQIAPWQQDFLIMALALEAERGSLAAHEIVTWMGNYLRDRFLADYNSVAFAIAPRHFLAPDMASPLYTNWQQIRERTMARIDPKESFPGYAGGYAASALGSLTSLYNLTGDEHYLQAIDQLMSYRDTKNIYSPDNKGSIYSLPNFLLQIQP
ncbi:MAG: right-handed parallel beta-helix repeat-containing protein [bacterium]